MFSYPCQFDSGAIFLILFFNPIEFGPRVHARLNKVVEGHSSSDVSLGPAHFLGCPVDGGAARARAWFVQLWNARLAPLVMAAVKEGLQVRFGVFLEYFFQTLYRKLRMIWR